MGDTEFSSVLGSAVVPVVDAAPSAVDSASSVIDVTNQLPGGFVPGDVVAITDKYRQPFGKGSVLVPGLAIGVVQGASAAEGRISVKWGRNRGCCSMSGTQREQARPATRGDGEPFLLDMRPDCLSKERFVHVDYATGARAVRRFGKQICVPPGAAPGGYFRTESHYSVCAAMCCPCCGICYPRHGPPDAVLVYVAPNRAAVNVAHLTCAECTTRAQVCLCPCLGSRQQDG